MDDVIIVNGICYVNFVWFIIILMMGNLVLIVD